MSKKEKKQKKEKIIYIDDGSTVSDMSAFGSKKPKDSVPYTDKQDRPLPRWRQILHTYFDSMGMMFLPMLVFMGVIAVIFLILWLFFRFVA